MSQIRIYKVKIRENVLRSVFFTDRNIIIGSIVLVDGALFVLIKALDKSLLIFLAMALDMLLIAIANIRVDRQPLYKILKRYIFFIIRDRDERF